jgi:N-acetylglucosaminyl-diphospho-decaprenol L-rhamnosyltransferase
VTLLDVVVVSYNSAGELRRCVEPLAALDWVDVTVVDNDSSDGSLSTIEGLPVRAIASGGNLGFATGCNIGWRAGSSPYVLFLNPDAEIDEESLSRLVAVLDERPRTAISAPRILGDDGEVQLSLRRFPRLRSTYAQAFFLDRLRPMAPWADEMIRHVEHYDRPGPQEWVSGACMLVRREVLERLNGWDGAFFLYCEDIDLCRRVHDLGLDVHYEPAATVTHPGGGSASRSSTLPLLAQSRVLYAQRHRGRVGALAERLGIALEAATHLLAGAGGRPAVAAHARALRVSLSSGAPPK